MLKLENGKLYRPRSGSCNVRVWDRENFIIEAFPRLQKAFPNEDPRKTIRDIFKHCQDFKWFGIFEYDNDKWWDWMPYNDDGSYKTTSTYELIEEVKE